MATNRKIGVKPTSKERESESSYRRRQPKTNRTNARISQTQTTRPPRTSNDLDDIWKELQDLQDGIRRRKGRKKKR